MLDDKDELNFIEVMDRVALILEKDLGVEPYDKQIAHELGMSPTQYSNRKTRNKIPYVEIAFFCDKHGITINWVLLGKSSMKLIEREEKVFKIRVIDKINASCGGGNFDDEEGEPSYIYIDKESAKRLGVINAENFDAINVIGDSMIPTIKEDSIVLIDRTKNTLDGSGIYVVNTVSGLFVKRLSLHPNGSVDLISDNKNYPTMSMLSEEVIIMGKVVGSLDKI